MIYKEYGKTGKKVSALGFGTSRFHPKDYATEEGREKLCSLLVKANDLGINYFDTWDAYGDGKCEEILGNAFKKMKNEYYVATKSHDSFLDADDLRRRLDLSLKRMGIQKINFFHMWRILNMEQFQAYVRKGGPYEGALKAQKEGLIDHICFSAHCNGEDIEKIAASGYFEGVLMGYNIINFKYREQGLMAAKKYGLGVGIMNPLGGGVVPQNKEFFSWLVEDSSETVSGVSLKFCTSQDAISVVLSGMTNETELLENIASVEGEKVLPLKRIEFIKNKLSSSLNTLCNGCKYCAGCPNGLKPYQLMISYNSYLLHNKNPRFFFEDIANWGGIPHAPYKCVECGLCEKKCSQHIKIRENIKLINRMIQQRQENMLMGLESCFGNRRDDEVIGIYAAGQYAKEMVRNYQEIYGNLDFDLFFFDSNPKIVGTDAVISGNVVHSSDDIEKYGITRLIIASEDYFDEIYEKLKHHEERGVKILKYTIGKQYKKLD